MLVANIVLTGITERVLDINRVDSLEFSAARLRKHSAMKTEMAGARIISEHS